jgi:N-acetyl sugar amidotransferase
MTVTQIERAGARYVEDPEDGPLEVKYGLPAEVRYCTRCVISNQRPSSVVEFKNRPQDAKPTIMFDDKGVCAACRFAEIKEREIDWAERERELVTLCDTYRSRNGYYDCVVPGSGGKDSAFTAHILKTKYGMNPLTVTWSPHEYTEPGWRNFQNWIRVGGFDNILVTPNGKIHRLLTRLAFQKLCHPFQPFIIGQRQLGPRMSVLYDIPLVFYGENQAEYGNNIEDNFRPTMDMSFFADGADPDSYNLGGVSVTELMAKHGVPRSDLNPYLPVAMKRLTATGTQVHYLGYYIKWDPQEMYYYAVENTGFEANTERTEGSYSKYSSIDDKIDPLHYYTTLIKFGIGRATYDAAQEIRNGKITREEGVALVRRFDTEFPSRHFNAMLDYMGLSEEAFWETIETFRSPHLWKREGNDWVLRHPVE